MAADAINERAKLGPHAQFVRRDNPEHVGVVSSEVYTWRLEHDRVLIHEATQLSMCDCRYPKCGEPLQVWTVGHHHIRRKQSGFLPRTMVHGGFYSAVMTR